MMKRILPWILLLFVSNVIAQDREQQLLRTAKRLFNPIPEQIDILKGSAISPERAELGKYLFFDPRLSSSWLISCNTCHNLGLAGVDLQETSVGHGWQRGPRNAPTVFNAVFNKVQFWDGRAKDLEEQAKGPMQASVEMNNTPERIAATLKAIPGYVDMFGQAFPDDDEPMTFDNVARAIEAFEATLLTPNSAFDRYLNGQATALSDLQKKGLQTFMNNGCAGCHIGRNVGGQGYFPFGVEERPGADILPIDDKGRFAITKTVTDEYVFKAPSLRNVALTPPYFHSGKVWSLRQAVEIMATAQVGKELSSTDVDAVTAFLKALNGEIPDFDYPNLPAAGPDVPRPSPNIARLTD